MADADVSQIRVGQFTAGIIGLKSVLQDMADASQKQMNVDFEGWNSIESEGAAYSSTPVLQHSNPPFLFKEDDHGY